MESFYKKLYDKYDKLKNKNLSELDDVNNEQEMKFSTYLAAAEEYIQFLKSENQKLCAQVNNLTSEMNSTRSTNNEQWLEYQKLVMEENQNNKTLSEEVDRLQKLLQEGISSYSKDYKNDKKWLNTPEGAQTTSRTQSSFPLKEKTRKRKREFRIESEGECMITPSGSFRDDAIAGQSAKENVSCGALLYDHLPECCKRTIDTSGGVENDSGVANCLYEALVEYFLGMKLSIFHQAKGTSISALHQSSGYSFSLTWVKKDGEEWELLYHMLSLGTFERVAPEWMREIIMFSMSMCPIFFKRMSRVIKLHH